MLSIGGARFMPRSGIRSLMGDFENDLPVYCAARLLERYCAFSSADGNRDSRRCGTCDGWIALLGISAR